MVVPVLLFTLGLVLLIKGGDWFVDGATGIAKRFHVPDILIGATVVSIGTTLPEVMVSATSAVQGHGEIAYGNAIGSIICNTALICALTIAIKPSTVNKETLKIPVAFFFTAAVFYSVISYTTGYFSRVVGIVLLLIFAVYMALQIRTAVRGNKNHELSTADGAAEIPEDDELKEELEKSEKAPLVKEIVLLVIGAALIAVGANLLVDNGTKIAQGLGVPESVIALTFVALGTSLPELVTAIQSLRKGHGLLSLGNIIGANMFNLVLVSGLSITLNPFYIPASKLIAGMNASLVVDIPVMLGVSLILTVPALFKGKLFRAQGILLLCIYVLYCVFQFVG